MKLTHSIFILLYICIFIPLFIIMYSIPRHKCSEIIDRISVGRKIDKPKHIHISECTGVMEEQNLTFERKYKTVKIDSE